jgi:hypothetical protein
MMFIFRKVILFVALGALVFAITPAGAMTPETLYFIRATNPENFDWNSGGNWYSIQPNGTFTVAGRLPQVMDTAVILTRVEGPSNVHVASLQLTPDGHADVILNSGTITADNLLMKANSDESAAIGSAKVTVTKQMLVVGGFKNQLIGTTLMIEPGAAARLDVDSAAPAVGGSLELGPGAIIFNQGAIVLTDKAAIGAISSGGTCTIRNVDGATLSSSGVATVEVINGAFVFDNNGGNIRADTGTLTFGAGITWLSTTAKTGKFMTSAAGATLVLTAFGVPAGVTDSFTGPGLTHFSGGMALNGILNVGAVDQPTSVLNPGHIFIDAMVDGGGTLHVLANSSTPGSMTLGDSASGTAGEFVGTFTGMVNIDAGGQFNLTGTQTMALTGTINNAGTTTWTGVGHFYNNLTMNGGTVFNNLSGAVFDIQNDQGISIGSEPTPQINNAGTFKKSAGSGTSTIQPKFSNSGSLQVLAGTISGGFIQTAGTTDLNGGAISGIFDLNGGSLIGSGNLTGSVHNNGGTISPGHSPGKLSFGNFTQGADGTLEIQIAGITTPGTDFDQLVVTNSVTLGGTLHVTDINGFTPNATDSVRAITAGFLSGTFSTTNAQVNYTSTGITVAALPGGSPTPTPTATPSRLANISTRLSVETGENVLIGGFIVTGTEPKKVLIRGLGPSLPVAGALADPILELYSGKTLLETNGNWVDSPEKQAIIATTIPPKNNLESAIVRTLAANNGAYTAIVRGAGAGTGIGQVEVYDLDEKANSQLANISTRGLVQTGENVMIGGFIVLNGNQKVIVRAIGPSLPVSGALQDPVLELHTANGAVLQMNDNWRTGGQQAEIIATTVPPKDNRESAIVRTLAPGNYTAVVRGVNNTSGVALVEVYALQ